MCLGKWIVIIHTLEGKIMKEKKKTRKLLRILFAGALTIAGFTCIPLLIKKYGNKNYIRNLRKENLHIEAMGPEIIPA